MINLIFSSINMLYGIFTLLFAWGVPFPFAIILIDYLSIVFIVLSIAIIIFYSLLLKNNLYLKN
jgi:hypothetical protein